MRGQTIEVTSTIINKPPTSRIRGRHEATEHLVRNMSNGELFDGGGGRGVDGAYGYAILRLFAVVWASIYHYGRTDLEQALGPHRIPHGDHTKMSIFVSLG